MDIIVIGAGSVGMLVASYITELNSEVKLFCRNEKQKALLSQHGLIRKNIDGSIVTNKVGICHNLNQIPKGALVIIAVKYVHLSEIYKMLGSLPEDVTLLFLQNGLAHLDETKTLPQQSIAFGSCQFGAEKENEFTVVHRGFGVMKIALAKGKMDAIDAIDAISNLTNKDFQIVVEEDAEKMLFEKALLNCFVNPLTTVLNVNNGKLIENEHSFKLLEILYDELMGAFPEERSRFPFEMVVSLCQRTAQNTSSMLTDMRNQQPTEVKSIVGAVMKRANERGKSVPTLRTLYLLVLSMEGDGG